MAQCTVLVCKNRSKTYNRLLGGITYHRFPREPFVKEKWIKATGRFNWFPSKASTICFDHFLEEDFIVKKSGNKYIKTGAEPCKKFFNSSCTEFPVHPTCIKVCSKEEYNLKKTPKKVAKIPLPYAHGKLMYAVKAGILVGSVYFTYTQGVWGDQQDVTECIRRWQEYIRSINTRRPPVFDQSGNVIRKESSESLLAPAYAIYKYFVTTAFSGVVKVPLLVKCAYINYLKAWEQRRDELDKERKIRRSSKIT